MKQASINSFFIKRSATASDDLILPAKKKIKSDTPQPTTPANKPILKKIEPIKEEEEEEVATPPIPKSPPSPKATFSDDDGDTEEDEELQEEVKKSISRRSQSMPEHALKAALRTNNIRGDDTDEDGNKVNGVKNDPKVDNSKSRLVKQQAFGARIRIVVLQIRQGDITEECTGAIVNAANSSLAHGGGVAGAISRKGGPQIQQESTTWVRKNGTVPSGKVAVTGPGRLPCTTVIHAVGPVWTGGKRGEDKELYSAVWHSLLKAHQLNLPSIAIPAISSGIFGFPKDRCAYIMTECAVKFCSKYADSPLKEIRFTNFDRETVGIFSDEFHNRFDSADDDSDDETNKENENNQPNTTTTTSKISTKPTSKTINTTSTSSPIVQTKKAGNNESGDETEEDDGVPQQNGYESSDSEGEHVSRKLTSTKNTTNHDDGDSSESDVEWGKWQK